MQLQSRLSSVFRRVLCGERSLTCPEPFSNSLLKLFWRHRNCSAVIRAGHLPKHRPRISVMNSSSMPLWDIPIDLPVNEQHRRTRMGNSVFW